eukprot:CAMPEP_0115333750 /NCGR_PEP_ID=MMETSP0270-20121206/87542_1 /TAXON_ID=71861 /ORGANISM="Scrippsiella trochoidea, Strain CCMP3099" /LENGTH=323 /DNA_ID=CAMNT_0002754683 /DNA_START=155 /DNA_END=1123 /DNA_ORIENTATION=-
MLSWHRGLTAGTTGASCHIGLDFGAETNARIEEIRFHPLYDAIEADMYINSRFEAGVLQSPQPCDELTYGWRGDEYRGCQDTAASGHKCVGWDSTSHLGSYVQRFPELSGHSYCRNPAPHSKRTIWCRTERGWHEECVPKMPSIEWTTLHTLSKKPRMLWNTITLDEPVTARFVRAVSPPGNCRFTEIQVIGQLIATGSSCSVAVRNVRRAPGQGTRIDLGRPLWRWGVHPNAGFDELASSWATSSDALVTFSTAITPTIESMEPTNGTARGGTSEVRLSGSNLGAVWTEADDAANCTEGCAPVVVEFNGYDCRVIAVAPSQI